MVGYADGWRDKQMIRWMDRWMDGWMDGWMNRRNIYLFRGKTTQFTNEQIEKWVGEWGQRVDGKLNRR